MPLDSADLKIVTGDSRKFGKLFAACAHPRKNKDASVNCLREQPDDNLGNHNLKVISKIISSLPGPFQVAKRFRVERDAGSDKEVPDGFEVVVEGYSGAVSGRFEGELAATDEARKLNKALADHLVLIADASKFELPPGMPKIGDRALLLRVLSTVAFRTDKLGVLAPDTNAPTAELTGRSALGVGVTQEATATEANTTPDDLRLASETKAEGRPVAVTSTTRHGRDRGRGR